MTLERSDRPHLENVKCRMTKKEQNQTAAMYDQHMTLFDGDTIWSMRSDVFAFVYRGWVYSVQHICLLHKEEALATHCHPLYHRQVNNSYATDLGCVTSVWDI